MSATSTDFLLAVGSGVVTDLTRRASVIRDLPFAVFGTAASMDGYTSITSAMMIDGMKTTLYGKQARLLMFDPAILATAPPIMQAAGVGDVYAKYNVMVDWKLGSAVAGETFCPLCAALLERALARCSENIGEIAQRTEKGMEALIEALILAGLTVLIVRYTRPVASLEHNLSHYFEMMALAYGGGAPSHGVGVGIGLIYALIMHDMLRAADLGKLRPRKNQSRARQRRRKASLSDLQLSARRGRRDHRQQPALVFKLGRAGGAYRKARPLYHAQYQKDAQILPAYTDVIRNFRAAERTDQRFQGGHRAGAAGAGAALHTSVSPTLFDRRGAGGARYAGSSRAKDIGHGRRSIIRTRLESSQSKKGLEQPLFCTL